MIRWDDLLRIGINNLVKRKLRTFLTLLGVLIGTASIVVMISLGNGMEQGFKEDIERMGSLTNIEVYESWGGGPNSRNNQEIPLTNKSIASIEQLEHVEAIMPIKEYRMKIVLGRMVSHARVIGTDPSTMQAFGYELMKGKELSNNAKNVILFSFRSDQDFYNPRSRDDQDFYRWNDEPELGPDGEPIYDPNLNLLTHKIILTTDYTYPEERYRNNDIKKPEKFKFKGIGILKSTGTYNDSQAFITLKTMKQLIREDSKINEDRDAVRNIDNYDQLLVKVDDMNAVEEVQKAIRNLGYETSSPMEFINGMKESTRMIRMVLAGIGGVSLLVAAIGIANTMIMSIYERTSEIGVLKVIGADLKDIRNIFLIESGLIGLIGGLFGIGLSYGISAIINLLARNMAQGRSISIIDFKLAISGALFATFIGLLSGYSPARRAMKLSVLKALRNNA